MGLAFTVWEAKQKLSEMLAQAVFGEKVITITHHCKPFAVILSVAGYERLKEGANPPKTSKNKGRLSKREHAP